MADVTAVAQVSRSYTRANGQLSIEMTVTYSGDAVVASQESEGPHLVVTEDMDLTASVVQIQNALRAAVEAHAALLGFTIPNNRLLFCNLQWL